MTTPPDSGPAFPIPDTYHPNGQVQYGSNGLSLRAYIATAALQGIRANPAYTSTPGECAKWAVEDADALIAELNKEKI